MDETPTISILHLEDNALDAELTAEILKDADMDCRIQRMVHLEDFQEVLKNYPEQFDYDLVLADFNMPGYDGMEVLQLLRNVGSQTPFVLLSGALGEELAVELLRSGATDYVLKHNLQRLPLVIRRALDEHQSRLRDAHNQAEIRKARDDAEKANSAKGRFLGRISHELRTPLNAILGYTQLMQADPLSDEQQHCAEQILKAGEHLLHLINEVLDLTRIESGSISVSVRATSLTEVIERAASLVSPLARDSRVTINLDGGPCNLFAMVDRDRLAQVLINLMTNAIKYNHPGGHVYVECQEERPGFVKLVVRDTGIGIPPEKMDRLFTPFDRLDLERDSRIPGTGLGLTVSKALVEAIGGTLGVISSDHEGTIFWVEVPSAMESENDPADTGQPVSPVAPASLPPGCKVLLLEGHEGSRDFLSRVFERRGHAQVQFVTSVEQAIHYLQQDQPDVIIMEVNLPERPGEELVYFVSANDKLRDIPIVVTTVDSDEERKARVEQAGVAAYFVKPIKVSRFLQVVSQVCRREPVDPADDKDFSHQPDHIHSTAAPAPDSPGPA